LVAAVGALCLEALDLAEYLGVTVKVVINAASAKLGGAVTYITNVLRCLPPRESGNEFDVFLPPETAGKQPGLPGNVRLLRTSVGHGAWWKRIWWEQITLRRWLKREKACLLFSTANFGMFRCPTAQLLLVRMPLYFSKIFLENVLPKRSFNKRVAFRLRRWLCCRSVRSADIVMTPTQAMLDDLRQFVSVDPRKALVNPYGVAPADSSLPGAQRTTPGSPPAARQVVRLLYVSLYSEHKNLSTLLRAIPLLNSNGAGKFVLRTTVDPAWEQIAWMVTVKEDLRLAHRPDVASWVEFLGPLARQQTLELYGQADVFVFPPLCESFGHPMVEAMAHGLPIVASDTPVNREICGDAAVYFSPLSAQQLARQVRGLAEDGALMAKLGAAGRERAATLFRWDKHVQRILECAGAPQAERR
jgi:glycosyltransferase involved in cell wall biosynthesis